MPYLKFLAFILTVLVMALFVQLFLPWWSVVIICTLAGFLWKLSNGQSFLAGFLGVSILWGSMAAYIDLNNQSILSDQIGALFGGLSPILVILLTAFIGGLMGGLGALTGIMARKLA